MKRFKSGNCLDVKMLKFEKTSNLKKFKLEKSFKIKKMFRQFKFLRISKNRQEN
jgi:hypothetical protein